MRSCIEEGDHVTFRKTDMKFHHTIVSGCESPSLLSAWEALNHGYWAYFGIYLEQQNYSLGNQVEMHRSILKYLRRGEYEKLRESLTGHYIDISMVLKVTE